MRYIDNGQNVEDQDQLNRANNSVRFAWICVKPVQLLFELRVFPTKDQRGRKKEKASRADTFQHLCKDTCDCVFNSALVSIIICALPYVLNQRFSRKKE